MAKCWDNIRRNRDEESMFLNQDFNGNVPTSKINLGQRFGLGNAVMRDNQYENCRFVVNIIPS